MVANLVSKSFHATGIRFTLIVGFDVSKSLISFETLAFCAGVNWVCSQLIVTTLAALERPPMRVMTNTRARIVAAARRFTPSLLLCVLTQLGASLTAHTGFLI